jgi:hypothetical protein
MILQNLNKSVLTVQRGDKETSRGETITSNTAEEEWKNIRQSKQTAAKEVIGYKNKEKCKE